MKKTVLIMIAVLCLGLCLMIPASAEEARKNPPWNPEVSAIASLRTERPRSWNTPAGNLAW